MIAVALSGGVDSTAAAICLHEQGKTIEGITLYLGEGNPSGLQIERASSFCRHLGIPHHLLDVRREFQAVTGYFLSEYLSGRTPNPCALCNRDIKFGVLLEKAITLGAELMATGHYVRQGTSGGRCYLARAQEANSQEYFLGLLSQDALRRCVFPLGDITRKDALGLVAAMGMEMPLAKTSQDACFIGEGGYVAFIESHAAFKPEPGDILDMGGHVIGRHKGALCYTLGQRKGLGMGFGRPVYVLEKDMERNTITVGDRSMWRRQGFSIKRLNFMKTASLEGVLKVRVKVRYRQEPQKAVIRPSGQTGAVIEYGAVFAPGQLAVFYDNTDAILCAGIIDEIGLPTIILDD